MFPSQDYIAKNGIGNLIALPLNGQKLSENKTIFVNDSFEVIHDYYQWLNSKKFIKYNDVLQIISELDDFSELGEFNKTIHKNISELNVEDFKDDITIIFSNEIYFSLGDISKKARRFLKRLASFVNKQYYINERKHISNYQVPRIYSLFKEDIENQSLILPRGCYDQIKLILNTLKINYKIKEKLNPGKSISVEFNGRLKN
jgi:hypothetical protein